MPINEMTKALNEADGLYRIKIFCANDNGEHIGTMRVTEIVDLINRLQADKEALIAGQETLQKALAEKNEEFENQSQNFKTAREEIERLSDRNHKCIYLSDDETTEYCVDGPCPKFKTESKIKAEAIKEFAEFLKNKATAIHKSIDGNYLYEISNNFIDNLVKEMIGE